MYSCLYECMLSKNLCVYFSKKYIWLHVSKYNFFVKNFGTKYLRERNLTDGNVSNRNESIGEDLSIKE